MLKHGAVVVVDFANLSYAFDDFRRINGWPADKRLDYIRYIRWATAGMDILSKTVYFGINKEVNQYSLKIFLRRFLNYEFKVVAKECKIIRIDDGITRLKANFDVEITYDISELLWKREFSELVLISGDSDFAYLVDKAKGFGIAVTIVSSRSSLSNELRTRADRLFLMDDADLERLTYTKRRNKYIAL